MLKSPGRMWIFTAAAALGVLPVAAKEPIARESVLQRAAQAMTEGHFAEAEALLAPLIIDPDAPVVDEAAVLRENMRRIRRDYRLDADALLAKIQKSIPDATAEDLERWRERGELQFRVIDGQVCYFAREPSNLLRFSEDAKARRTRTVPAANADFNLPRHIARLLARAENAQDPEVFPVRHHVTYTLRVNEGHPRVKPGALVRCWLPFPQEYRQQKDVQLIRTQPEGGKLAASGAPHRTVYFERTIASADEPLEFSAEFEFTTSAYVPNLNPALALQPDQDQPVYREYTAQRPPHIVFTPEIQRIVEEVAGNEPNPLLKAKKLFAWMDANVRYCAEMEYSTIPSICAKGIGTRRGDCGVQGLLFITLCRAAGVPARWQSGWESLPSGWNMHDWAEFYVEPWGWLPADPSYGLQKHHNPRVREFYCGHLDPYRLIVNLDYGQPLDPPKTSYRSEPNDFQRGEIEIDGHNLYFDEWDWTFDVRTMPLERSLDAAAEALDAIVPGLLAAEQIPGAVIAVGLRTDSGYKTWASSYGYMQLEPARLAMPVDALFDMASVTKPVAVGTSLAILLEQGKVLLDDPVGKYLPEFATGDKQAVTVRHLVTHMSGAVPYLGALAQKGIRAQHGFPCPDAMRAAVRETPLSGAPGEQVRYSCLNAMLTAEIVEKVSGQRIDQFAAEHIFQPLGMLETCYNPPAEWTMRCVPTTRAEHGAGPGGFLRGQVHDPMAAMQAGVSGNAGLFSTAHDLGIFAQMMLDGGARGDVRILQPQTVKLITSPQNAPAKNRRGVLWEVNPPDPEDQGMDALYTYGHTGYTGTAMRLYPEKGLYIIALTNRVHPDDTGKVEGFRRAVWKCVGEAVLGVR